MRQTVAGLEGKLAEVSVTTQDDLVLYAWIIQSLQSYGDAVLLPDPRAPW